MAFKDEVLNFLGKVGSFFASLIEGLPLIAVPTTPFICGILGKVGILSMSATLSTTLIATPAAVVGLVVLVICLAMSSGGGGSGGSYRVNQDLAYENDAAERSSPDAGKIPGYTSPSADSTGYQDSRLERQNNG